MIINQVKGGANAISLASIYIKTIGETIYTVGNVFSLNGYVINAVYTDMSQTDVTSLCSFTPSGALTEQDTEITISYQGKTCIQNITVTSPQIINYAMLYDYGDQCTSLTGGWIGGERYYHYIGQNGVFNLASTYMQYGETGSGYASKYACTQNEINVDGYSVIFWKARIYNNSTSYSKHCGGGIVTQPGFVPGSFLYYKFGSWVSMVSVNFISTNVSHTGGLDMLEVKDCPDLAGEHCFVLVDDSGAASRDYMYSYCYALAIGKNDNWQQLCTIAGLNPNNYADESALCANSTAMTTILSNSEAVNYMKNNCTGSFMMKFVVSSVSLNALNASVYRSVVYANEHWAKFLAMAS